MRSVIYEEVTEQQEALYEAIKHSNNAEAVKLIESGMDVNICLHSESLLEAAILSHNLELAKLLVAHGAEVNYVFDSIFDEFNAPTLSPLRAAIRENDPKCAEILIEQGADVNEIHDGKSLIHWALWWREGLRDYIDVLKVLLAHNVNLLHRHDELIPAEKAALWGPNEYFELLENAMIEAGLTRYLLPCYAALGNLEKVREIIDSGVDIKQDNLEKHAILFAAEKKHEDCLKFLLEHAESLENSYDALLKCITNNYVDCLKLMFAKGCDVNTIFERTTPLITATRENNLELVKMFIALGADVNLQNSNAPLNNTPLNEAIIKNNLELVEMFIGLGADVNLQIRECDGRGTCDGPTPLHYAIHNYPAPYEEKRKGYVLDKERSEKCIKLLLEHGADINRLGKDFDYIIQGRDDDYEGTYADRAPVCGRTPLHTAAREGKTDCLKLLLEYHPCVTLQDANGDTAAKLAARAGNSECYKLLLNAMDDSVLDPKLLPSFASVGQTDKINQIIDSGIDLNANNLGNDVILLAAKNRRHNCLKFLIDHTDTIDKKNMAIYYAAENGYTDCLKRLIEKGCDINMMFHDCHWQFPLLAATAENYADCVEILLEHGADPNAKAYSDKIDETALCAACRIDSLECVDLLLAHGANVDLGYPLGVAISHGSDAIVQKLLDKGAKVTGLYSAVGDLDGFRRFKSLDILQHLLEHINEDDVINNGTDDDGRTPLIRLCNSSFRNKQIQKELAQLFLSHGADVNAKDHYRGGTALHAISNISTKQEDSFKDIIELLLNHGADVNANDNVRNTPLHKAAEHDCVGDSIACLLSHGADIHALNRNDQTPLDIAKTSKNEAAIKLLTEREQ